MTKLNFYLIRHGKTVQPNALNGATDVLVNDDIQEAISIGLHHSMTSRQMITSPLRRCADVATRLAEQGWKIQIDHEWRELNFGRFDGVPYDELGENWQQLEAFWADPNANPLPESEPLAEGFQRVVSAWQKLVASAEQDTVIMTHGGVIRFVLAHLLKVNFAAPTWYGVLNIGNQTVTHIELLRYEGKDYFQVKGISLPIK